jgi:hypothetical protein
MLLVPVFHDLDGFLGEVGALSLDWLGWLGISELESLTDFLLSLGECDLRYIRLRMKFRKFRRGINNVG